MKISLCSVVIAKERSDCGNLLLIANIPLKFGLVNSWIAHANIRGWSQPCPLAVYARSERIEESRDSAEMES